MRPSLNHNDEPAEIRMSVLGILEHRDIVLRAVSSACKLVTGHPHGPDWQDFQAQVVSAVSEAFNNLVLHGYQGRRDGRIDLILRPGHGQIQIELRDWGKGFDPTEVPMPELDALPESGLGLFIMQSFMGMTYRRGRPNLLTLSKKLEHPTGD
jgi:anti-sigma regulatory factor (Ser/Thr protein kinase)